MKINSLFGALLVLLVSCNLFAKTINISYSGKPVLDVVQLAKGDVVMINTSVNVGTRVMIRVSPVGEVNINEFKFTSSMENVTPDRTGSFLDQMFTGANPGWISYTYTGANDVKAKFELIP